jgi:putative oxygen-independent coproporphyrinogen III oxidase
MSRSFLKTPPLSLYIHLPWCVKKCPYCDFNSHELKEALPQTRYIDALEQQLAYQIAEVQERPIISIFFGGGTPSLFSGESIQTILDRLKKYLTFAKDIEITLEANPGTADQENFRQYRAAGVNRLSLGIQSLQNQHLRLLGRIHDRNNAIQAVTMAKTVGFEQLNIDIMYGLPDQSPAEALIDLKEALALYPTHFSWYQLTLEPNTLFYVKRPTLPSEAAIESIEEEGLAFISQHSFTRYEVSAFSLNTQQCIHNMNYWQYGDYLGLGAGAHSKITNESEKSIKRFFSPKSPKQYLQTPYAATTKSVTETDSLFEFMLNALRLTQGFSKTLLMERTGLSWEFVSNTINKAIQSGLLLKKSGIIQPSPLGRKFLNNLTGLFLPGDACNP